MRWVAFLRAINVGGRLVTMDRLRAIFAGMGLAGVETFIASGNVIFDAGEGDAEAALTGRIEAALREGLGYPVETFLRAVPEVQAAAALRPFAQEAVVLAAGGVLHVAFLRDAPGDEARARLLALATPTDEVAVVGREAYWLCHTSTHVSKLNGGVVERAAGMSATLRNVNTVRRLAAKLGPLPSLPQNQKA